MAWELKTGNDEEGLWMELVNLEIGFNANLYPPQPNEIFWGTFGFSRKNPKTQAIDYSITLIGDGSCGLSLGGYESNVSIRLPEIVAVPLWNLCMGIAKCPDQIRESWKEESDDFLKSLMVLSEKMRANHDN